MKIVHIIPYFQPQFGYQEYYLASEQQKLGHEVFMITSDRYYPFPNYSQTTKPFLGERKTGKNGLFVERDIKTYRLKTLFEYGSQLFMIGINDLIKKLKPDIIHLHGVILSTYWPLLFSKRISGIVFDSHATYDVFNLNRIDKKLFYWFEKKFIFPRMKKYSDGFIGVAEESCDIIEKEYGFPKNMIYFIPNGADEKLFTYNKNLRDNFRKEYRIDNKDILIAYIGKLTIEKEPHILIKTGLSLLKKYKNLKLLIVGNGPDSYVKEMKLLIKKENQEKNIIWIDRVEQKKLPEIYSSVDIAVWPAECSMTMIEASSIGIPIIVAEHRAIKHRIKNDNGFSFNRGDTEQLQHYLELLIKDEKLREKMGKNGRQLVKQELSWPSITKKTMQLYEKLIT